MDAPRCAALNRNNRPCFYHARPGCRTCRYHADAALPKKPGGGGAGAARVPVQVMEIGGTGSKEQRRVEAESARRASDARRELYARLTPAERRDMAVLYALASLVADEPIRLLRGDATMRRFFARLQREYREVVAPGRRAAGLPVWAPPPGFFDPIYERTELRGNARVCKTPPI